MFSEGDTRSKRIIEISQHDDEYDTLEVVSELSNYELAEIFYELAERLMTGDYDDEM